MKDFIMLDGTLKTLPKLECNLTVQDFLDSNEWGADYGYEFKLITYDIDNLTLLDEYGNIYNDGIISVQFRMWLNDNGIERDQLLLFMNDGGDVCYWYPNLYRPDIPIVEDIVVYVDEEGNKVEVDPNEGETKIVGWKYNDI